ncbi:GYF domain containing protein [Cryptosporidium felis]|nr:GYF domain containing protein [Cryptosporidium felis]
MNIKEGYKRLDIQNIKSSQRRIEKNDSGRTKKISNDSGYYYRDDKDQLIGPFSASLMLKWINEGYFDNKGNILVREVDDLDYVTLDTVIPKLLQIESEVILNRLYKDGNEKSIDNEPDSMPIQSSAIDPIGRIPAKDIYLQEPTCDLDIVLIPNDRATELFEKNMKKMEEIKKIKAIQFSSSLVDREFNELQFKGNDKIISLPSLNTGDLIKRARNEYINNESKLSSLNELDSRVLPPVSSLRIPVHSNLLSLASPIMREEINQIMESRQEINEQFNLSQDDPNLQNRLDKIKASLLRPEYKIKAIYPEAVRMLLLFIYGHTTSLRGANPYLILTVLHEARRFKVQLLEEELFQMLNSPLNIEVIVQMSSVAESLEMEGLIELTVYLLADCAQALFKGPHLALGPDVLLKVLKSERILMGEIDIFLALKLYLVQRESSIGLLSNRKRSSLEFLKNIRFEQMAPHDLLRIRTKELDSLLLDAALNKLLGNEGSGRLVPWKENSEFTTNTQLGLYPVALVRRASVSGKCKWAWTIGDYRLVSDMIWQIQVCKTYMGRIRIGVCCRGSSETNNTSQVPKIFYYDFMEKRFGSAFQTNDVYNLRSRINYESGRKENLVLRTNMVLQVRVNISRYNLILSISDITNPSKVEFETNYTFVHGCSVANIGITKRPFIETANFVEMLDDGDKLKLK